MTVTDRKLLAEFRTAGLCELCGKHAGVREPHHCFTVGASGGHLDVRENLVALSGHETFVCRCHHDSQRYVIPRRCVLTVIAHREGLTVDQIETFLFALRRAPRGADVNELRREAFGVTTGVT